MTHPDHRARPGTFVLDGLLEGTVPPTPGAVDRLRAWPAVARESGLRFTIAIEGNSFSVLGDPAPLAVSKDAPEPIQDRVVALLEALLDALPDGVHRQRVFSTLRSVEYADGVKRETVYASDGSGGIREVTRESPWTAPRIDRTKLWIGAAVVGVLAVTTVLFAVGVFGEPRELLRRLSGRPAPTAPSELPVDAGTVASLLAFEVQASEPGRLVVNIGRLPECPPDLATYDARRRAAVAVGDAETWRALEAAFLGRLWLEILDDEGRTVLGRSVRLGGAWTKSRRELELTFDPLRRAARVVVRPD